jgi:hypothetical protein
LLSLAGRCRLCGALLALSRRRRRRSRTLLRLSRRCRRHRQGTGIGIFKADILPAQAGAGFGNRRFKRSGSAPEEDYLLRPGRTQSQGVIFRKQKGGGKVRGRFQRVHQQHAADNGFQVSPAFDPAGDFHPGFIGKGDQMEGIPQAQIVPEKRAGKITVHFPVAAAHGGGGIQKQN